MRVSKELWKNQNDRQVDLTDEIVLLFTYADDSRGSKAFIGVCLSAA